MGLPQDLLLTKLLNFGVRELRFILFYSQIEIFGVHDFRFASIVIFESWSFHLT